MAVTDFDNVPRQNAAVRAARRRVAILAGIWALAAVPFLIVALPPVMDVPNHLTRIWLLAGGLDQAPLSSIYEARWSQAATNIFVDLIGVALARIMPLAAVGKTLMLMMFLAPPLAALWLNRNLFGRTGWWPLAGIAIVWSTTAVTGLISYQIALAVALAAAALAHPIVEHLTAKRLAAITGGAAVLLLIHPFGALFFLLLLSGLVLGPRLPHWPLVAHNLRRIALISIACIIPVLLLLVLAPHPPGTNGTHSEFLHWQPLAVTLSPTTMGLVLLSPFLSYKALYDVLMLLPLLAVMAWAAIKRQLRVHAGLLLVAGMLELLSPFLPMNIGDGGALVIRFPEMAALMALAGLSPSFATRRQNAVLAGVLMVVALIRIGSIGWIWQARAGDIEQLKAVTRTLPPGASVMVLEQRWSEARPPPLGRLIAGFPSGRCASERHFASLVVMWRKVFIPTLFTVPGQQPLAVKPPYNANSVYSSGVPFLEDINLRATQESEGYLVNWQKKFDYVLLLNADLGHTQLAGTHVVADEGFARLYRVAR